MCEIYKRSVCAQLPEWQRTWHLEACVHRMNVQGPSWDQSGLPTHSETEPRSKIDLNWFILCHQWPFLITKGWLGYFLPVERSEQAKNQILPSWIFFRNARDQSFTIFYMNQKTIFGSFLGNLGMVFLRKITLAYSHFSPKRLFLAS